MISFEVGLISAIFLGAVVGLIWGIRKQLVLERFILSLDQKILAMDQNILSLERKTNRIVEAIEKDLENKQVARKTAKKRSVKNKK
jgi:hypothetical protein